MEEKRRNTGIDRVGQVPWGTHFCLFYHTREDLIDILVPYFKTGLENNEFCMWVTSEPISEKDAMEAMIKAVPDLDSYLEKGHIEIVPHTEWYLKGGGFNLHRVLDAWIDKLNQALAEGYAGIRVTGDAIWPGKIDWEHLINYEKEVNNAIDRYRMLAICTYPLDRCGASEVIDVVGTHRFVITKRGGEWELIENAERKRAERLIKESEERYRNLVELTTDIIYISDREGNKVFMNDAGYRILETTPEEAIGKSWLKWVHPDDRERTEEKFMKMIEHSIDFLDENRLVSKSGRIINVLHNVRVLRNEKGEIAGVHGIARDITERKHAEEALQHRIEMEKLIAGISTHFINISPDEVDSSIDHTLKTIGEFAGVDRSYVFRFYDGGIKMDNTHEWCDDGIEPQIQNLKGLSVDDLPWFAERIKKLKTFHVPRVTDLPPEAYAEKEHFQMQDIKSLIVVPMVSGTSLIGFLGFDSVRVEKTWPEEDIRLLKMVGEIFVHALERRRVEESLMLFSEAVEEAPNGVQITDLDGYIIYSNRAVEDIYGFSPAEYKGRHVNEMNVDPEFASSVILPGIKETGRWIGEVMVRHKDGHAFPVWLNASVIKNSRGEPIAIMGIITDITERKRMEEALHRAHDELELRVQERTAELEEANRALQAEITERMRAEEALRASEERYRRLVEFSPDGIIVHNLREIIFVNPVAAKILGASNPQELIGIPIRRIIHPDYCDIVKERLRMEKEGKEVPLIEEKFLRIDGSPVDVEVVVIPCTYMGKREAHAVVRDITEKKKLEAQLLRAQRMESIGTLAGGIAHDINNILTPIMLSMELFRERFTDEESKKLLDIVERSAQRGSNMVKQVMSFARGVEGERIALQVTHIIAEIVKVIKETFPRSIEIRTDILKGIWMISGDATQLHQVLMNLCVNARDAMPYGGILSITAENVLIDDNYVRMNIEAKVGPYIVIAVSDTGDGISPEIFDRVFEPFFTTKEPGKGTGLGLSTALAIVKSHGGFINIYSEVGRGTTFKIHLPALKTTETQRSEEQQYEIPVGHGELILVVDDEVQIREITRRTLEKYGYRVITAADGAEAISLYLQHKEEVKAVLMDMIMPIMEGPASIRALSKLNSNIKIIAVSGLADKDKFAKVADTKVHAFLTKPYTAERLLKTIHEVIK
ncbi:PAS domain S-box [Candidatus Methanoperedens nitroreducens]|uniref:PAS domain S-box n=1 Tax=Candidatus Methanoperedens nitratireducens TaxID=1392998 RepID=A0A062V5T9_9EURY|nr:PAS domain S-box protein [Candidatus Methanoperedens nitroreducens]KCZ71179.1 PAS domain S-box [Candidatus Methanoperedens nitroreducens]MDJ1421443.1 PAS domain S-box protein [Candidatus Methanoperedens sp.]